MNVTVDAEVRRPVPPGGQSCVLCWCTASGGRRAKADEIVELCSGLPPAHDARGRADTPMGPARMGSLGPADP